MTHRAANRGGNVPRLWLLPILGLTVLLGITAGGVLSRSLVLDLIAWWPVWAVLALLTFLARGRRLGRVRLSGLVPLAVSLVLGVFAWGHIEGWPIMPSASQSLIGPRIEPGTNAALSARVDGTLIIGAESEFLYEVDPVRRGGTVGVPNATEQSQAGAVSVMLAPALDPGLMVFSGWEISLSPDSSWSLTLEGDVSANLTGFEVNSLQASGGGNITLAATGTPATVNIDGVYTLAVPSGAPVRIVGEASVPSSWEKLGDGWRSPTPGEGWVVSPTDSSVLTVIHG